MGDNGWWVIIGFVSLFEPLTFVLGVIVGLLIRRWPEVIVAAVAVPLGHLLVHYARNPSEPFLSHLGLLPFEAAVGLAWAALAFAGKKFLRD